MKLNEKELNLITEALYHYAGWLRVRTEDLLAGDKYDKLASKIEEEIM